jgi:hypothetical protein
MCRGRRARRNQCFRRVRTGFPARVPGISGTRFGRPWTSRRCLYTGSLQNYPEMLGVHTADEGQSGEGR